MPLAQKIFDLRRLDYITAEKIFISLVKKKTGIQLRTEEILDLEFFDCLRLLDGYITKNSHSILTILLNTIYNHTSICLRAGTSSSDLAVFKQVLGWTEYEPVVATFKQYFQQDKRLNIIDAGANVGLTSVYFSAHFDNSKIISIEPDPDNFTLLLANVTSLNVTCIQGAVWSKSGQLKLVNDFRDKRSWSCRVEETIETDTTGLPAYTISQLKEVGKFDYVDILKIDIEGSEKELFAQPNPDFLAYTRCIAIEIHDEFNCRDAIYQCLEAHNFLHFNRGELTIGINRTFLDSNYVF